MRYGIAFVEPASEVNRLATITTKRHGGRFRLLEFFFAKWAMHGRFLTQRTYFESFDFDFAAGFFVSLELFLELSFDFFALSAPFL